MRLRSEPVALDTIEFIFAMHGDPHYPDCERLVFEYLPDLRVLVPGQVIVEPHRNLTQAELPLVYEVLDTSVETVWDYSRPPADLVDYFAGLGARKGDAVVAAHVQAAGVHCLASENRHFLSEIPSLPFVVLSASEMIAGIGSRER